MKPVHESQVQRDGVIAAAIDCVVRNRWRSPTYWTGSPRVGPKSLSRCVIESVAVPKGGHGPFGEVLVPGAADRGSTFVDVTEQFVVDRWPRIRGRRLLGGGRRLGGRRCLLRRLRRWRWHGRW